MSDEGKGILPSLLIDPSLITHHPNKTSDACDTSAG